MAGSFGYELDLCRLTEEEKQQVKRQIEEYHKYWDVIHNGDYYRLTNPMEQDVAAWQFVREDKRESLIQVVMQNTHGNPVVPYVKAAGLDPEKRYREEDTGVVYTGAALMYGGIPVPQRAGEYLAYRMYLVQV